MKTHAYFDVDRTIRKNSAALDFCHFLVSVGLAEDTFSEKDSEVRAAYNAREFEYQEMVGRVVAIHGSVLQGLSYEQLQKHYERFVSETGGFFDWTEKLFLQLRNNGVESILVSAGISPAITAIANHLQADTVFASQPEVVNGIYTGKVTRILHDAEKKELVGQNISKQDGNILKIGFGDSTGDVSMLELMDHVFVIDPHQPEMMEIAKDRDWTVVREGDDLIAMLGLI